MPNILNPMRLVVLPVVTLIAIGCAVDSLEPSPPSPEPALSVPQPHATPQPETSDLPVQPFAPGTVPGLLEPQDTAEQLVLMTWNLENFPQSPQTADAVVQLLDEEVPDVVALQEITDVDAFDALLASLPAYEGVLNDDEGAYQRVGVLYRADRVQLDEMETLFASDWYAFPRPPLRVGLTWTGESGTQFDFSLLSVHLKAMVDDESAARRRTACERLEQWVREESQRPGADPDIMIAGDWNDELTDPEEDNVFTAFLERPEQYRFLTNTAAEHGDYSYIPFKKLIDHVMVTTDSLGEYGDGSTEVLRPDQADPSYRYDVSDHRPVVSRFRVTSP